MRPRVTVLYDEDCGFCRWSVARLLALDPHGALRPEPIQGPVGDRLLVGMSAADRLAQAHAVTADGQVYSGGDVIPPILGALGAGRAPVTLARALQPALRRGYGLVANRRSALGSLVSERMRSHADRAIERHREWAIVDKRFIA